jgi:hypothetical protein
MPIATECGGWSAVSQKETTRALPRIAKEVGSASDSSEGVS